MYKLNKKFHASKVQTYADIDAILKILKKMMQFVCRLMIFIYFCGNF